MKTIVPSCDRDQELAQWQGSHARLWFFHVTFNRLLIRLLRQGNSEVLYVLAVGCRHIEGPFSWHDAKLVVSALSTEQGDSELHIIDHCARFNLSCQDVILARGREEVVDSLDDFFSDGTE